ncbi:XRN 5'-3' exonuclease N-terminus family protein [Trichomonas vaginalis G3]|uniref:XRN 5'-3' exonuclease N-terminus family protein n=1 Tax=Trichomonas vaginalis (strain ATCC PRA-98 / G3) TaxID=412133 RepID=A2FHN6_TRIV3|nr:5'-3' exoribonuclease protein [Trichomonas vaginalis G3]EAX95580.1 XRN 5'-3' exonuclease N-terminus family protein [Trichomonas vaginalis G3]KAI5486920.1 5'-3' exoribonuclease protein [Trichomonas vaginalis G3]|eukprot:XP_001308510.1 XRN 5'-3' exonuclease N-terminus family protein [Trichomonas vaginalis G3]
MGVAGFFKWLISRYPSICRGASSGISPSFDCFFVDFNCIIHNAIRTIQGSKDLIEDELITEVLRFLDILVHVVQPTKLLYISVDGPAPLAKCIEQRSRRFSGQGKKEVAEGFTKNSITIGTKFMNDLHLKILDYLKERVNRDPIWAMPHIIYDSYHTPGEGEHKLINFIRYQRAQGTWNEDYSCCIYSPDADIFFIALNTHMKKIAILKDSSGDLKLADKKYNSASVRFWAGDFIYVYLSILRQLLAAEFFNSNEDMVNNITDDFCAISSLLGNDFIPSFPFFNIDNFNNALEVYFTQYLPKSKYIVENGEFNYSNLSDFLRDVAYNVGDAEKSVSKQQNLLSYAEKNVQAKFALPEGPGFDEKIKEIVYHVMDSFVWVLNLYTKGILSWEWYYPYSSAPPLLIISKYLQGYKPNFTQGAPPKSLEVLVSLLPANSANLLPSCLQFLAEPGSPVYDIMSGSARSFTREYFAEVKKIIQEKENEMTDEEKIRNTICDPFLILPNKEPQLIDVKKKYILPSTTQVNSYFPSLTNLPLKITLVKKGFINSTEQTKISCELNKPEPTDLKKYKELKGKVILVDFPYFNPAIVTDVFLSRQGEKFDDSDFINPSHSHRLCVKCRKLTFPNYKLTNYSWSDKEYKYPFIQTAPFSFFPSISDDIREEIQSSIKKDSKVFILSGEGKGKLGVVKAIEDKNITVQLINRSYSSNLKNILLGDSGVWIPIDKVAENVHLSTPSLLIILDSITSNRYGRNIGLKFIKNGKKGAEGYVSKKKGVIVLTPDVQETVEKYISFVGADFMNVVKASDKNDIAENVKLYFDKFGDEADNEVKKIAEWVSENSQAFHAQIKPLYLPTSPLIAYKKLEEEMEKFGKSDTFGQTVQTHPNNIVLEGKLLPFNITGKVNMGDHVAVLDGYSLIPFGTSGIVIGVINGGNMVQIVADQEQQFGSTMVNTFKKKRMFYAYTSSLCYF